VEDIGVVRRIILRWIFMKWRVREWTEYLAQDRDR
jgi:hypothetical protein